MQYRFLYTYLLVLLAVYYTYKQDLGIHKQILANTLRALLQLVLLGYVLLYVFKIKSLLGLVFILFGMTIFASWTAQRRVPLHRKIGYITALFSIGVSSAVVLTSMILAGVVSIVSHEFIPLGGMIIGNSINIYTLVVDRMKAEVNNTMELIESRIALGATLKEALMPATREASKAAFIPILNSLQTVGIIHIPGITTGMLLAGAEPLKAVSYQVAIMYMLVAVALFTGIFTVMTTYKLIIPAVCMKR